MYGASRRPKCSLHTARHRNDTPAACHGHKRGDVSMSVRCRRHVSKTPHQAIDADRINARARARARTTVVVRLRPLRQWETVAEHVKHSNTPRRHDDHLFARRVRWQWPLIRRRTRACTPHAGLYCTRPAPAQLRHQAAPIVQWGSVVRTARVDGEARTHRPWTPVRARRGRQRCARAQVGHASRAHRQQCIAGSRTCHNSGRLREPR